MAPVAVGGGAQCFGGQFRECPGDLVVEVAPAELADEGVAGTVAGRLGEGEWVLQVDMHHIAVDGGCFTSLLGELFQAYEGHAITPEPLRYVDYAVWQVEGEGAAEHTQHEAYWLKQYAEELPVLELPLDRPRPATRSYRGGNLPFALPAELAAKLRQVGRQQDATLQAVLLALWQVLLGAARPVHILTPSATIRRIINMTAWAVTDVNSAR